MSGAAAVESRGVTPRRGAWRTARELLLVALAYAALTVLYTWPAVTQLNTHLISGPWDGQLFLWQTWWGGHAAFELGEDPLVTRQIYHPVGTSLVVTTHVLLPSLLSWPLQQAFGLAAAFDLMVLLTFVLSGLGTYLLAREIGAGPLASFVAGAAFAFGPLRVSQILFFNLIQSWLLPFWAWTLWRAWKRRSLGASVAAGVVGAATFWTDYTLAVLAASWAFAFAIFALLAARSVETSRRRVLVQLGVTALACAALSFPLAQRLFAEYRSWGEYESLESFDAMKEATPVRHLVDATTWRAAGAERGGERAAPVRQGAFLGYATLLLVAIGVGARRQERATKLLGAVAIAFLLLSLGGELNLGRDATVRDEQPLHVPLPYRWAAELPVLGEIRVAHRFGVVAWLALAVAAGLGADALARRFASRAATPRRALARAGSIAVLAAAGVMLDFTRIPFAVSCELPPIPEPIREIAADRRDVAVLGWPGGRTGDPFFSWYHVAHGKPVHLDGQLARMPDALIEAQRSSPSRQLLRWCFADPAKDDLGPRLSHVVFQAREERRAKRIGWLVLSQLDHALLANSRKPFAPKRLDLIRERIARAFPDAKLVWEADAAAIAAFVRPDRRSDAKRWSAGTLFAVYRLP